MTFNYVKTSEILEDLNISPQKFNHIKLKFNLYHVRKQNRTCLYLSDDYENFKKKYIEWELTKKIKSSNIYKKNNYDKILTEDELTVINNKLVEDILQVMQNKRYSAADVSAKTGINYEKIYRFLYKNSSLNVYYLIVLAKALGYKGNYYLDLYFQLSEELSLTLNKEV